jgi:nucleoside-diphosphate-sugar epimerase
MMKNAIVAGATSFVGFSLCQKLIRREVEVYGMELLEKKFEPEEDKLMEIGRNAFFHFQGKMDIGLFNGGEKYDAVYFCLEAEELYEREYLERFTYLSNQSSKVFLVAPRNFAERGNLLQKQLEDLQTTLVIHPALFGPWQPDMEPIQRKIMDGLRGKQTSDTLEMENQDILFVEDIAEVLLRLAEKENDTQSRTVLLANKDKKALELLAHELDITIKDTEEKSDIEWEKGAEVIYVESSLNVTEALAIQRNHAAKRLKIDSP